MGGLVAGMLRALTASLVTSPGSVACIKRNMANAVGPLHWWEWECLNAIFSMRVQPGLSSLSSCLKPDPKVMQATNSLCSYFSDFALCS